MKLQALLYRFRFVLISIGGLILLLTILFILSLNAIIERYLYYFQEKFHSKYGYVLIFEGLKVSSYNAITFKTIKINKENGANHLELNKVKLGVNAWSIFTEIRLNNLKIQNANITYHDIITDSMVISQINEKPEVNINKKWSKNLDRIFSLMPNEFEIKTLNINYISSKDTFFAQTNKCLLTNNKIDLRLQVNDYPISINGTLIPESRIADIKCQFLPNKSLPIPPKINKWKADLFLDQSLIKINDWDYGRNKSQFEFQVSLIGLGVYHSKLDKDTLYFDKINTNLIGTINDEKIELDSSSSIYINKLIVSPYFKFEIRNIEEQNQDTSLKISWNLPQQLGQNLFDAFPRNGFSTFSGIKSEGKIQWQFSLEHVLHKPDSLKLYSNMTPHGLKITQYGETDYRKINGIFVHYPYFNNRKIIIGEGAYTPYHSISPILIHSVLNAEDGGFFHHKGFLMSSIIESAIEDMKLGYFRRGGSTISMQLVKNIFLGHQKTIMRKLEEMLIVWIIENLKLSSKQRMLEVYLNAIEWGPNVYGITEASNYYFYKHPSQLTLEESIFLAMIIPHPRAFGIHFDKKSGILSENNLGFFQLIARKLLAQNVITQEQFNSLNVEEVILSIEARKKLQLESGGERYTKKEGHSKLMQIIRNQNRGNDLPEIPDDLKDE